MAGADWREIGFSDTSVRLFFDFIHYGKHRDALVKIAAGVPFIRFPAEKACGLEMHPFDNGDIVEHEVDDCADL